MKRVSKNSFATIILCAIFLTGIISFANPLIAQAQKPTTKSGTDASVETWAKPNAKFEADKMGDMSGWDPLKWENPKGDVIKIAIVWPHSGPATGTGEIAWACATFAAYDINQRGGILVDGKKKKIALYKADTMSKQDQAKKICERMVLQEKVDILVGSSGSNIQKVINEVGARHKVITQNVGCLTDDLQDATNFSRYSFMSSDTTTSIARGMAYYYGQIRKKEKKFYILCQDYSFGRDMGEWFKKGLKEYYPEAEVVGEDYHKLFLTDFAPYLTKITSSGAEVVWTGDWLPDAGTLLKQARQMDIKIPFANLFVDEPNALHDIGVEGTKGLVNITHAEKAGPAFKDPGFIKYYKAWNDQWKKWNSPPYKTPLYEHGGAGGTILYWTQQIYWLLSVIERAQSTDPEKIISIWEGDTYQFVNGRLNKMRICDHKAIQGFRVAEYVPPEEQKVSMNIPPYYWFKGCSYTGPSWEIPAEKVLPLMDPKLDRCKGKNEWGE
jgi:ABC-type branched-subunit amino acid transport system substrate-binding protein